jgi:hypothetical protein
MFVLGAIVAWLWVLRVPGDPDRWGYAIGITCAALWYAWKMRHRR